MLNSPSKSLSILKKLYDIVGLPAQYEDAHGISKTVFTHVSRFHGLLNDWLRLRDKGTKLCKTVITLKLHECTDDYFPHQLEPLTEGLLEVTEGFKDIVEGIALVSKQLQAIAKLQHAPQPVITTWTAKDISDSVDEIYCSLLEEYRLKTVITENIAHCRDEKQLELYATAWEIDTYLNLESTAYLFAEVGLNPI